MVLLEGLDMCLMDVIITYIYIYIYGSIDNDICMKILEGFKLLEANNTKLGSMSLIKLQ